MSLRVERSETKQSQGLRLLRFARNDGKYFCLPTYISRSVTAPYKLFKQAQNYPQPSYPHQHPAI